MLYSKPNLQAPAMKHLLFSGNYESEMYQINIILKNQLFALKYTLKRSLIKTN